MRRTVTVLLCTTLALTAAACGSDDGPETDAKPKTTPTPTADPGEKFMAAVRDANLNSYASEEPPAGELKAYPPRWCEALEAGHSVQWILGGDDLYPIGETWGTEKTDAYQLILLGAESHCPKQAEEVREELRETGEY